jgi:alcohol oxidase
MGHPEEVDVIVAGGGPAGKYHSSLCHRYFIELNLLLGCVVAGRLAYADPSLKVMLIEG